MKLSPLTDCETDCAMNGGETVLVTGKVKIFAHGYKISLNIC